MSQNKVTKLSFWFSLSQRRVLLSTWLGKSENSGIGPQISLSLFTRHHPAVSNKACDSSLPNLSWNHVLSPSLATLSPQSVTDIPQNSSIYTPISPYTTVSVRKTQWRLSFLTFAVKSFQTTLPASWGSAQVTPSLSPWSSPEALLLVSPCPMSLWLRLPPPAPGPPIHQMLVPLPGMPPSTWLRRLLNLQLLVVPSVGRELKCHRSELLKIWNKINAYSSWHKIDIQ